MARRRAAGEGTIFQDNRGYWVAEVTLPDGKRKRKYSKVQKTVKEWLLRQRKALQDGIWVEDDKITVAAFLERFLNDTLKNKLKPKTIESYSYLITNHINPTLGEIRLTDLKPQHLQAMYAQKIESGLSARTVQYTHAVLHRSLDQAAKWGLVVRNVADLVEAPRPVRKPIQTFTAEQCQKLLAVLEGDRLYPFYALSLVGLRLGELLGVHWEDVNFTTGTISIRHTIQVIKGKGLVEGEPKTDKSRRSIQLPDFVIQALKQHREKTGGKTKYVFSTSNDTPFSPRNIERHFKSILEKAELPIIRFHDLRHTAATLLLVEGIHPKVVQELLGHSTISMTMDLYSHVLPTLQQDAAQRMNKIISVAKV
jgi:integrase